MVASGLAAALIGAVTLRLRADYLAITTFGVAVCIQLLALNLEGLTGGPFGIGFIPRPFASLQGDALSFNLANLALVAAVTVAVYCALERLVRGPWGRVLRAIREDEAAAIALGKNPFRLSPAGLRARQRHHGSGGAMQGHFIGFIAPENYLSALTFQVWAMLIIGGSGNNRGAILGAVVVWGFWTLSGAAGRGDCSRRVPGARARPCRSSRSAWRSPSFCCFVREGFWAKCGPSPASSNLERRMSAPDRKSIASAKLCAAPENPPTRTRMGIPTLQVPPPQPLPLPPLLMHSARVVGSCRSMK